MADDEIQNETKASGEGMSNINPLKLLEKMLSKPVGDFLSKVIGPPAETLGGLLGDQMKSWRASNLDRIARKWDRVREERGISEAVVKVLPFGEAYRAIEAVSVEENENVQELWARLIASATDNSRSVSVKKVFIDLLKSLGNIDAVVLEILFDSSSNLPVIATTNEDELRVQDFIKRTEKKLKNVSKQEAVTAVENLIRLRIISIVIPYRQVFGELDENTTIKDHVRLMGHDQTADALINICKHLNTLAGWSHNEGFDEMDALEVVLYAVNSCSFTHIGWELLHACAVNSRNRERLSTVAGSAIESRNAIALIFSLRSMGDARRFGQDACPASRCRWRSG